MPRLILKAVKVRLPDLNALRRLTFQNLNPAGSLASAREPYSGARLLVRLRDLRLYLLGIPFPLPFQNVILLILDSFFLSFSELKSPRLLFEIADLTKSGQRVVIHAVRSVYYFMIEVSKRLLSKSSSITWAFAQASSTVSSSPSFSPGQ